MQSWRALLQPSQAPEYVHALACRLVWAVVLFMHYFNHSVNFVLYVLTGSEFRQELKLSLVEIKDKFLCFCRK